MGKTAPIVALIVLLLAGCAAPVQQGSEAEESLGPPGGVPEGGKIELPDPELAKNGPIGGIIPPPVWLVAGGKATQASYGEFCDGDLCIVSWPQRSHVPTAEVPAGEKALVVVDTDKTFEFSAGVIGWKDAPTGRPDTGVFTKSGIPYYMRVLDSRRVPEGEGPTVKLASDGEDGNGGPYVFELDSTGNPGDRQLSVFLKASGSSGTGRGRAEYRWRLDPDQEGDNPPPEPKQFPGSIVEIKLGSAYPVEDPAQETAREVTKVPFGGKPHGIEAGEGYLWVLNNTRQSRTDASDKASKEARLSFKDVLLKADPDTREVLSTIDEPSGFAGRPKVGAGAVWLAVSGKASVARVDPESEAVSTTRIGGGPREIAPTEDGVWVAVADDSQSGRVVRLDPKTGEVVAEIETPGIAQKVAVDPETDDVWVVSLDQTQGHENTENNQLVRIDPATNEIAERFKVEGGVSDVIAAWKGKVWISSAKYRLLELDPKNRAIERASTLPLARKGPGGTDVEAGSLWLLTRGADGPAVARLDLESGRATISPVDLGKQGGESLAAGEGGIWVVGTGAPTTSGTLTRITPQ